MVVIHYISFSLLLFCCIIATVTDTKKGTIDNRMIMVFLCLSVVLDAAHYLFLEKAMAAQFALNASCIAIVAILLYYSRIWAGGDSKLLIVIGLLYPAEYYWKIQNTSLSFIYIVFLMFSAGFIYILFDTVCMAITDPQKLSAKSIGVDIKRSFLQYVKTLIYLSALCHIYLFFVLPYIALPNALYMLICIGFIWALSRMNLFESKVLLASTLLFDVLMTVFTRNITISTLWSTYVVVILFIILRNIVNRYNYKTIPTSTVHEGMILSQATTLLFQSSKVSDLPGLSDETLRSRLTRIEAESVRRWEKTKYGQPEIVIVRKIPFAVFMLSGVLLYHIIGRMIK